MTYHGQILDVEIGIQNVEYTLRERESIVIRHETEEIQLIRERLTVVRPVSRSRGSATK